MGSGVRVVTAVGGVLASGTVAAGSSKGVGEWKEPTAARESESATVGIRDGSGMPFFVVLLGSGTEGELGTASL